MMSSTRYVIVQDANTQFDSLLAQVSNGVEHVAIQAPGQTSVYLISQQDYGLFQALLEAQDNQQDIEQADARMMDGQQELIEFDQFFDTLDG